MGGRIRYSRNTRVTTRPMPKRVSPDGSGISPAAPIVPEKPEMQAGVTHGWTENVAVWNSVGSIKSGIASLVRMLRFDVLNRIVKQQPPEWGKPVEIMNSSTPISLLSTSTSWTVPGNPVGPPNFTAPKFAAPTNWGGLQKKHR